MTRDKHLFYPSSYSGGNLIEDLENSWEHAKKGEYYDADTGAKCFFDPSDVLDIDLKQKLENLLGHAEKGDYYDADELRKYFTSDKHHALKQAEEISVLLAQIREALDKVLKAVDCKEKGIDIQIYGVDLSDKSRKNSVIVFIADGHGNKHEMQFVSYAIQDAITNSGINPEPLNPFNPNDLKNIIGHHRRNVHAANIVFLGDTMDRGDSSLWNLLIKLSVSLLSGCAIHQRGNHESKHMNLKYGTKNWITQLKEDYHRAGFELIFSELIELYEMLPDCSQFGFNLQNGPGKLFTCHGGIYDCENKEKATANNVHWSDLCQYCNINSEMHDNISRGTGQLYHEGNVVKAGYSNLLAGHKSVDGHEFSEKKIVMIIHSSPEYGVDHKKAGVFALVTDNRSRVTKQLLIETTRHTLEHLKVKDVSFLQTFDEAEKSVGMRRSELSESSFY